MLCRFSYTVASELSVVSLSIDTLTTETWLYCSWLLWTSSAMATKSSAILTAVLCQYVWSGVATPFLVFQMNPAFAVKI